MTIQPHKIYKITKRNGEVFIGLFLRESLHSKIFKDETGKFFEIKNSEIQSFKLLKDLTDVSHKSNDTDMRLKYKKSGRLVPTYKQY